MVDFPAQGSLNWRTPLQVYIDSLTGLTGEDAAIANLINTAGSATDVALKAMYATGGGGGSLTVVSGGTIDLDNSKPNGYLIGYHVTATTTIEGVSFATGSYIFERDTTASSGWTYRTLAVSSPVAATGASGGSPTLTVTGQTSTTITIAYSTATSGVTGWQYRLDGGTATALDGTSPDTITGIASSHTGTIEARYTTDGGTTYSPWALQGYTTSAASLTYIRMNAVTNNNGGDADTDFSKAVYATETGDASTGWVYAEAQAPVVTGNLGNTSTSGPHLLFSVQPSDILTHKKMTADGSVTFPFSSRTGGGVNVVGVHIASGEAEIGLRGTIGSNYEVMDHAIPYSAGGTYGTITVGTVVAAAGDWMRFTRSSTTITAAVSKDSGSTWTTVATKTGVTVVDLSARAEGYAYTLTRPYITGTWS